MPEGRSRQQKEAVRVTLGKRRGEVMIRNRELVRDVVVERQDALVVIAHRATSGRVGRIDVRGGEPVHLAAVPLLMRSVPGMAQVRDLTFGRLQERTDGR